MGAGQQKKFINRSIRANWRLNLADLQEKIFFWVQFSIKEVF